MPKPQLHGKFHYQLTLHRVLGFSLSIATPAFTHVVPCAVEHFLLDDIRPFLILMSTVTPLRLDSQEVLSLQLEQAIGSVLRRASLEPNIYE